MRSSIPLFALVAITAAVALLAPRAKSAPGAVSFTQFTASTTTPGHSNPTWCPDGSQIAFDDRDADVNNPSLTYKNYPVGSENTMALAHRENMDYKPDLTQIVYAKLDSIWDHLYVRPIGGGTETAITTGTAGPNYSNYGDIQPCYSPDGLWVAFSSSRGDTTYGTHTIWVVKTDGTGLKKLGGTMEATWPTWQPDGNAVVYTDGASIYRVAKTGASTWGSPVHVADHANHVRFSHDGKFLAFDYQGDIWVMNYATLARANLTNDGTTPTGPEDSSPTWGKTNDQIAFASRGRSGDANTDVWVATGVLGLITTPAQVVTLGKVKAKYR